MADEPTPTPQGGAPEGEQKMLTQEQVDKIVQDRLARDREARNAEAEAARKKLEDEKKSEVERLASQLSDLQTQLAAEKEAREQSDLKALRLTVGRAVGIPDELAELLQGSSEEELKAHAARVKEALPGGPKPPPSPRPQPVAGSKSQVDDGDEPKSSEAINDWLRSKVRGE